MVYLSATSLCLLICFHSKWQFSVLRWALGLGLQKDDGPVVGELVIFFFFWAGHWAYVPRVGVAPSLPLQLILSLAEGK